MKASNCPSCGAPVNPSTLHCEYCGSYLVPEKDDENFVLSTFSTILNAPQEDSVVCICGRRLEKGEYPIRSGMANLYRGMMNAAGGHLILTNRRFLFVDHGMNLHLETTRKRKAFTSTTLSGLRQRPLCFYPNG